MEIIILNRTFMVNQRTKWAVFLKITMLVYQSISPLMDVFPLYPNDIKLYPVKSPSECTLW
jgi:hypothetical protein